jgi:thiol-disulfide isomerase/thioredoxin
MTIVGLAVLVGTVLAATAIGLVLRARAGRVRAGRSTSAQWARWGVDAGTDDRVLLLQLSTPVCAPCRQAAVVLTELAERNAGLRHVEIDIADDPEPAVALSVMRTPTIVAFDRAGHELLRVSGVPRTDELMTALRPAMV